MLRPVRPSLNYWYYHGILVSPAWVSSFFAMDFVLKRSSLVAAVFLPMAISSFMSIFVLSKLYIWLRRNPEAKSFFYGYERAGKTTGYVLVFFGNIGLYYYSEKSVACMMTFLFLAMYCLSTLFCIQPYTDFGVLEFLLSASMNQALSLFGIRSYWSWIVIIECIGIGAMRYCLEPVHPRGEGIGDQLPLEPVHPGGEGTGDQLPLELVRLSLEPVHPRGEGTEDQLPLEPVHPGGEGTGDQLPLELVRLPLEPVHPRGEGTGDQLPTSVQPPASNFVLSKLYFWLRRNPETESFFYGYERAGKTTGYVLVFFGNIGLYYYSEKSVVCMTTSLFLAVYRLSIIFYIQPYTDFGILSLLCAFMNQELSLFKISSYWSWIAMLLKCIGTGGMWYFPKQVPPRGEVVQLSTSVQPPSFIETVRLYDPTFVQLYLYIMILQGLYNRIY